MLAANVLAWLRWGTDLPFLDDWRAYDEKNALSLSPSRLFEPINNTISPIGLALDAFAQRWLGGNPLPYQTLSMLAVLGGLLWQQWLLLKWVVRSRLQHAALFALTMFMLQPGAYWGEQSLAYHQALPLLALLGALLMSLREGMSKSSRIVAVWLLGMIAGLSYVSGAIGALVMGATLWLIAWALRQSNSLTFRAQLGGMALVLAGAVTTLLQLVATRRAGTREQVMSLTWPDSLDFWAYLLGKIGRSSGQAFASLGWEAAWVGLILFIALLVVGRLTLAVLLLRPCQASSRRLALVLLPLLAMVVAYLVTVTLGRAGYRDPAIEGAAAVFRFAYERFHFFWVTLLFPWLAAACLYPRCRGCATFHTQQKCAVVGLILVCGLAGARGVFDIWSGYRSAAEFRATEIKCLMRQIGTDRPFTCPGYAFMGLTDLTRAYNYAREIDASFVRYFPVVERDRLGSEWVNWNRLSERLSIQWEGVKKGRGDEFVGGVDPQALVMLAGSDPAPATCLVMGVRLELVTHDAGHAQVFYRPSGVITYQEAHSVRKPYAPDPNGSVSLEFVLESPVGFEPQLRIDPVDRGGRWEIRDLRVACRVRAVP